MTTPTPPAVSEAMREAVARLPEATYDDLVRACRQTELDNRRLASEIARLTGERDAARSEWAKLSFACGQEWARAEAAEAETARLRAALAELLKHIHVSRYRCCLTGLRLDGNIPAFTRAEAALTSQEKADV